MKAHAHALPRIVAGVMRWGSWGAQLNTSGVQALVEGCLAEGITAFDHADIYGDYTEEAAFGRVLAKAPQLRGQMQLVTKCGIRMVAAARPNNRLKSYDSSGAYITASVDNSLNALHTDYLDVLLLHRPDMLMDAGEVARTFESLRDAGKVRAFGVSNFTVSQFALLESRFAGLVTNQLELSLTHLDALSDGTLDQAQQHTRAPIVWSPLGGGKLVSASAGVAQSSLSAKLQEVADRYNVAPEVIAYAWVLRHPSAPSVVTGSSKLPRILQAKRALDLPLDRETWYELLEAARGREVA